MGSEEISFRGEAFEHLLWNTWYLFMSLPDTFGEGEGFSLDERAGIMTPFFDGP